MDLLIIKLTLMGDQGAAIIMAGKNGTIETIQGLPESLIGKMGQIEQDAQAVHLPEQMLALEAQSKLGGGAACIATGTIMRGTDNADARFFPGRQLLR